MTLNKLIRAALNNAAISLLCLAVFGLVVNVLLSFKGI